MAILAPFGHCALRRQCYPAEAEQDTHFGGFAPYPTMSRGPYSRLSYMVSVVKRKYSNASQKVARSQSRARGIGVDRTCAGRTEAMGAIRSCPEEGLKAG